MKKLTDRELRAAAGRENYGYAFVSLEDERAAASELLARRAEVRRLRAGIRAVLSCHVCEANEATQVHLRQVLTIPAALSRRAGKGRGK